MMLGLMDCNNFYVSCERAFNPKLEKLPVLVLSNNDGCVVSRSNEAKELGIKMAIPFFKIRDLIKPHNIQVLSSNYALYADMSQRVMRLLNQYCPEIEVYSIDEAFLNLSSFPQISVVEFAKKIAYKIKLGTGIPVSIGLAPTKTLAKIANTFAKKQTAADVFSLPDLPLRNDLLANFPVQEIWGVGWRNTQKLQDIGIHTAYELSMYPLKLLRKHFNVKMERIALELQGVACSSLEDEEAKKNIQSSKSFGRPVVLLNELQEAISCYAATAAEKLRRQKSLAKGFGVFLRTSRFKTVSQKYSNYKMINLTHPTDDTRIMIKYAINAVKELYRPGYEYNKCGIILLDVITNTVKQYDLLTQSPSIPNSKLMQLIDNINQKHGKNTLNFAAQGTTREWSLKANLRSPRYTTEWKELIKVL